MTIAIFFEMFVNEHNVIYCERNLVIFMTEKLFQLKICK